MNFNEEIEKELNDGKLLVETAIKMRQELTDTYYGLNELRRIYIKTIVSDYFIRDNVSKCDTGSVTTDLIKKRQKKL